MNPNINPMYIARFDNNDTTRVQTLEEHLSNCCQIVENSVQSDLFRPLCVLAARIHDFGKYSSDFQNYIEQQRMNPAKPKKKVIHSLQGAMVLTEVYKRVQQRFGVTTEQFISWELIRNVVISHHGIRDMIEDLKATYECMKQRLQKQNANSYNGVQEITKQLQDQIYFDFMNISEKVGILYKVIQDVVQVKNESDLQVQKDKYGLPSFYWGMVYRFALSELINADWTDAACFSDQKELPTPNSMDTVLGRWNQILDRLETYLSSFKSRFAIDKYRREISDYCVSASVQPTGVYRFVAPTGSGKTLASLRFAIRHAIANKMSRIFYIAPFNSILEQNANEIRRFIDEPDNPNLLLEHHCNYEVNKNSESDNNEQFDEMSDKYEQLTQTWDSSIVATSAVQFLNALFSDDSGAIRRFHALENSVIIIDEIQALPIRCINLFNLAMNFLTVVCKSTVVLCSATQPPIDKLQQNSIKAVQDILPDPDKYQSLFRRTKVHDDTTTLGCTCDELVQSVMEKVACNSTSRSALIIVNTKSTAKRLYLKLKDQLSNQGLTEQFHLFHLSTNMCPYHRKEVISQIKDLLHDGKPVICVSTQLIEAGVDISFPVVFRSLAGLDSIIQAAGRCNRNGEADCGNVYIVKLQHDDENVESIRDIVIGQKVMRGLLDEFKTNPAKFDNELFSLKALKYYYQRYYVERQEEMVFEFNDTNLVDLLSDNRFVPHDKTVNMYQAFKTAGQEFEVISEFGKINLVVPYNDEAKELLEMLQNSSVEDYAKKKDVFRQLQQYTISVSENDIKNLSGIAIDSQRVKNMSILYEMFYSYEIGLSNSSGDIIC